jgi:histidyl-tRNA synthetase
MIYNMAKASTKKARPKNQFIAKDADTPLEVALYYGFTPIEPPTVTKEDIAKTKTTETADASADDGLCLGLAPEEKFALTRWYLNTNFANEPQPLSLYYRGPLAREKKPVRKNPREVICHLEILGSTKSIAEALLIETAIATLREEGFGNLFVEINNIGNRDSMLRFQRELTAYYRKHINDLPAACRQNMKHNICSLLSCRHEKCKELAETAPQSLSFLNEAERAHFQEILEFLESLEVPYRIANGLIGNRALSTGTVFQILSSKDGSSDTPVGLALGSRYQEIARRLGAKKDLPSAGVVLSYRRQTEIKGGIHHRVKKPEVFFIQLGFEAKLKCLKVIDLLRKEKIPVYQSLSRDKIGSQLAAAERMQTPFIIIMGQKEALENSVIVRNMKDRSQETIGIETLPAYLKKLRLA